MTGVAVETFVRVIEVWVPGANGRRLEMEAASYPNLEDFEKASQGMYFSRGEGLPGLVWQTQRPIVLKDFSGPIFLRKKLAEAAGLAAGIGIPVFDRAELKAVVVFLCGDPENSAGALEVWSRDVERRELCLSSGYYGSLKNLRYISNRMRFGKGVGLPGKVWESGMPAIMDDLAHTPAFLRAHTARAEVLKTGLGIPVTTHKGVDHVVLMLSALDTPLARVFEIWEPNAKGTHLVLNSGAYGGHKDFGRMSARFALGEGIPGMIWESRKPMVIQGQTWARSHLTDEFTTGIGLPVIDDGGVRAVVVLMM